MGGADAALGEHPLLPLSIGYPLASRFEVVRVQFAADQLKAEVVASNGARA